MTYNIDFVKYRKIYFIATAVIVVMSIFSLIWQGLNLGIDFVSGSRLDLSINKQVDLSKAKNALSKIGYADANTRIGGNQQNVLILRFEKKLSKVEVDKIAQTLSTALDTKVIVQEQTVDPIIGKELAKNAIISILIASLGIILYVTLRFEYRFAIAAILSLLYDAIFAIGVFSVLQLEVDVVFIAAILTIVGYSINDTIVIFDRIRENLKLINPSTFEELAAVVNNSINQTLVRSINTVLTVVFAAAALYIFGGESISNFSLALLFGIISGALSSILFASQLWLDWKWRDLKRQQIGTSVVTD